MTALRVDPSWRAQVREEGVVMYAGADAAYLLPDLAPEESAGIAALFEPGGRSDFDPLELADGVRRLLPQLTSLGAVRPAALPDPAAPRLLGVGLVMVGSSPPPLETALRTQLSIVDNPELLLVVRTNGTLRDLVAVAERLGPQGVPHLLVDLAYQHTAVLGPLVVPGAGACLACLAVRAGRRWGDPEPPSAPGAAGSADFVVALAAHAVRRIGAGSLALLDRSISYHLDELTTIAETVLPAADCRVCPRIPVGRVRLPWESAHSTVERELGGQP